MRLARLLAKTLLGALALVTIGFYFRENVIADQYPWGLVVGAGCWTVILLIDVATGHFRWNRQGKGSLCICLGALFALGVTFMAESAIKLVGIQLPFDLLDYGRVALFLISGYVGVMATLRLFDSAQEGLSQTPSLRPLLVDGSALGDARLAALADWGILDGRLVVPRFVVHTMQQASETPRGRESLEAVRKLEAMPGLALRYEERSVAPDAALPLRLVRLAELLDADILTVDANRFESAPPRGGRVLGLDTLGRVLKPVEQSGEFLEVRIQRLGKEAHQGVGYLEDGTMVVVNGGGSYIGQGIRTRVLSVKHTAAGRLIFCNAMEEEDEL